MIQTRLRDGWSFRKIAREIGCSVNTDRNEYSCGKEIISMLASVVLSSSEFSNAMKKLGRSIEERDKKINDREEFGHLECDLIVGNLSDDDVLLNIVERKTRFSFVYKLPDKKVLSVMKAFDDFKNLFGENFDKIFHTITTDNGSEFSSLAELEKVSKILVYFAHPYSSWEKGTVENLNGLFRRFIPKGESIRDFSAEYISSRNLIQS